MKTEVRPARLDLRAASAPDNATLAVCPHCWEVNLRPLRLCGRCGGDMHTLLQESGGLRATAAVQSPLPVRVRARLTPLQRAIVLAVVVLLMLVQVLSAIYASAWRPVTLPAAPPAPIPFRGLP